jgi:hypothetical protein
MSKPIINNRINYSNEYGRIIQHDIWLNQDLKSTASPTFANLTISGNTIVNGNFYVEGNTSILNTNVVEFKDNIIEVNFAETGAGVTLNQAGIQADRGSLENVRIVWNELDKRFEAGVISNLLPITIRENMPLNSGLMVWNSSSNLIISQNHIDIPITFTSTVNTASSTSGAFIIAGGIGIEKDLFIDGKIHLTGSNLPNYSTIYTDPGTNTLNIISTQDINLTPSGNINLPSNVKLIFGDTTQNISSDNSGNLYIKSLNSLNFTSSRIAIPNQIPLTFSTINEKIYTDSSNNMVIAGSQSIYLLPNNGNAGGKYISVPVDTPIIFNNINQSILSNISGDLGINAGNNILLNPGQTLDVKIPTDNGLKFGGSGNQRIVSNSNNDLLINTSSDLFLNASYFIKVPSAVGLSFSNTSNSISGDTNGNIILNSQNKIINNSIFAIANTTDSTFASNGSIYTNGGLGVAKNIICESSIILNSNNTNTLNINGPLGNLFTIDSTNYGKVNIYTGDGTFQNPSLELVNTSLLNSESLIQLKAAFDTTNGYTLGRGSLTQNTGRLFTLSLPTFSSYSNSGNKPRFSIISGNTELFTVESDTGNVTTLGTFGLSNTQNSTSPTTGSFVIKGGLGVVQDVYTGGIYIQQNKVNNLAEFQIKNSNGDVLFNIDSINSVVSLNTSNKITIANTNAFTINNNNTNVLVVDTINNTFNTTLQIANNNTTDSTDTSSGSTILHGGLAIQKNVNIGGSTSINASLNMNTNKIINVASPTSSTDAANKMYVDLIKQGLYVKDSVDIATTTSQNLNTDFIAGNVIDNYTLVVGNRILIKNQSNGIENGIYTITNGTPTRPVDFASGGNASGVFVFIKSGLINSALGFICNSHSPNDIIDTNSLNFTEFTGLGQIQTGTALSKIFNEINVNVDNVSIEVESISNSLRIKNTAVSTGLTGGSGDPLQTTTNQSHVTILGTINTGVWQATNIGVSYGGTGKTSFNTGNILFGNGTNGINTDSKLYYDNINTRLGLGTNTPTKDLDIKSTNTVTVYLEADSDANNINAKPEISLSYSGSHFSHLGMTRNFNEYAINTYPDALILSNDQIDTSSIIQLATNQKAQLTILSNGHIGINTTTPNYTLTVNGTLTTNDIVRFVSTQTSDNSSTGSVILEGGLSIDCQANSTSVDNGGAMTILGGASIARDLYIGGNIIATAAASNTFSYLTITATDNAINLSTGSLVTFGGITIQTTDEAYSVTNGGSFLTPGGAAIGSSLFVGKTLNVLSDTFLGSLYCFSNSSGNFIQSSQNKINNTFSPLNFTNYNNTNSNLLTIYNSGVVTNNLQIGGSLSNIDGYTTLFTNGNLNIVPNGVNYNINFGTIGSLTDFNIYGNNSGQIKWQSTFSNLLLTNSTIQLNKLNSSGSIILTTPNTSGSSYIQANGSNMTLNLGNGSVSGQLTTILSNDLGNSSLTFTPSNTTSSSLVLTNNVYSTFNGPITLSHRVEYSGNALHQTISNTNGNSLWVYFGQINGALPGYTEIDFNSGNNSGLNLSVSINNTTLTSSHQHYGNLLFNSVLKPIAYIYNDTLNNFHLFVLIPGSNQVNINVKSQRNNKFLLINEGTGSFPDGTASGYNNSIWVANYTTNAVSTLKSTIGDLTVEGINVKIADNLPVIGYNNSLTTNSRDLGILYQRYQIANNNGTGDIVNLDNPLFIDSIPSQSLVSSSSQIKFSNLSNSTDNYYNNWWIKIGSGTSINQVRQIVSYNGSQHIATLVTPFTTQNPSAGDTVYLYNNAFVTNYFDTVNDTFALGYTSLDPGQGSINITSDANLRLKSLYSTDTTVSVSSTSGSVYLLGGISISNTNNAISSTNGGTFTTSGGIAVKKNVIIGGNIGLGVTGFTPQESIHIRKPIASARLESDIAGINYIDFVENTTTNRFGIVADNSAQLFSLTNSSTSQTPDTSNKALSINNLGYVGINTTTNINSPLTLNQNSFISTNSSTGFLGLIGGNSNINGNGVGSRIILNSNNINGNIGLYTGNVSTGNVNLYSGNDTLGVSLNNSGIVNIYSTQNTKSCTQGALITSSIGVFSTENSNSITSGGALTVNGGTSISKDLYIGGNIFIQGNFTASGSVQNPTITFISFSNCSLLEYHTNNLVVNGSIGVLTFGLSLNITNSSQDTQVVFHLPGRTNNFTRSFEVVSNCSGLTDSTNNIPLFNVLGFGIIGSTNLMVKFQSNGINTHYLQIQSTYILA